MDDVMGQSTPEIMFETHGTAASDGSNHRRAADLQAVCSRVVVEGASAREGQGAAVGAPGLDLGQASRDVELRLFEFGDLTCPSGRLDGLGAEIIDAS